MNEIREIVTRAVLAKGKKLFRVRQIITPEHSAFSVLGCWVINHEFEAKLNGKRVDVSGNFEIDIWYAYDNNSRTEVARGIASYEDTIKVREIVSENIGDHCDVIARVLQQPTCTNARIVDEGIEVEVIFEILVEVIGETKMMVTVFTNSPHYEPIDDFENEINEDFLNDRPIEE